LIVYAGPSGSGGETGSGGQRATAAAIAATSIPIGEKQRQTAGPPRDVVACREHALTVGDCSE
jgi:hypothetical protein